tara:strand:+ start:4224 stop:4388 length:165 start_codon:yes stop_codon:yes gene_type:complete
MGIGSYLRFFVGLILSLVIIKDVITGGIISGSAITLSITFVLLSGWFFVSKFMM